MKNRSLTNLFLAATAICLAVPAGAADIERPKVEAVDALGVNLVTGQVTHSLTPVSIGGAMGLGYRISIYANEANAIHYEGFSTSYTGIAKKVFLTTDVNFAPRYVMLASDDGGSEYFKVWKNGILQEDLDNVSPPYTYEAIGDKRHSLVVVGSTLEWTKPDGTVVRYGRTANAKAGARGYLTETVYPNGFTIKTIRNGDLVVDVFSNAGYQLRGIFELDTRPMDKADNPNLIQVPPASSSAASGWSYFNPKYVKAINNAYEYCAPAPADCAQIWPKATIEWPAGMPRTLFIGDSVVKVTDAGGAVTEFRYRADDLALGDYGEVVAPYVAGIDYSPRLAGIKTPGSTQESFNYTYRNLFIYVDSGGCCGWNSRAQTAGMVSNATHLGRNVGYVMMNPTIGGQNYRNYTVGIDGGIKTVHIMPKSVPGNPNLIEYIDTVEGKLNFETTTGRNFPSVYQRTTGPTERYLYDARGNLEKLEKLINGAYVLQAQAHYPATCTAATSKICNQADWIADARGNVTNYTYHQDSGQVASVTSPPDADGRRAQTRYEYTQKAAHYFNGGPTKIDGSLIWMKTAERYCIDSSYTGSCGDEVMTRFDYNHDNLLLTGTTVTAPNGSKLCTRYQYDRFGNQIGQTQPNAHLGDCN